MFLFITTLVFPGDREFCKVCLWVSLKRRWAQDWNTFSEVSHWGIFKSNIFVAKITSEDYEDHTSLQVEQWIGQSRVYGWKLQRLITYIIVNKWFSFWCKNLIWNLSHCKEIPIYVIPEKELGGLSRNFHSCLWAIYIFPRWADLISCSRIRRPIVGIYMHRTNRNVGIGTEAA